MNDVKDYSTPIQTLHPHGASTPTKSDPHFVELQAMKQILSALVSQQDRLLTQLSTQQSAISRMEKKQDEMAFEILELRRLNHAQYDQLLQIHQDTTETKRHQSDVPPVTSSPRCTTGHPHGFGCFFSNGVLAATVMPYSPDYMIPHFSRPCCPHIHEGNVAEMGIKKAMDTASKPTLKPMRSDHTFESTLIEPPGSSASSHSSRSQARPLPSIPPQ